MPSYCSAYGCSNISSSKYCLKNKVSFHPFPLKDRALLKIWMAKLRRDALTPSQSSKICSKHFQENCFVYQNFTSRRQLKSDAVPTKFSFTSFNNKRSHILSTVENMEYISCFVPGCKSKCPKETQSSIAVGEQIIHMFSVPHSDRLFDKWQKTLGGAGKELTKEDHICELHFRENEIERFYITETSDGSVIEIEKSRPSLKSGTAPSLFLDLPVTITKDSSEKLSTIQKPVTCSKKRKTDSSSIISLSSSDSDDGNVSILFDSSTNSTVDLMEEQISPVKECVTYQELVENLQLIKRPSKLWSVVCTDKFIIFARWNDKYLPEKRIVIESSLIVRVFVKEWEINITDLLDITSTDDISTLLDKVESYNINFTCS